MGHALASFNPAYGQGMTVAPCEALALRNAIIEAPVRRAARFFAAAAKIIDVPWQMVVGGDLALPQVPGPRPFPMRLINTYIGRVQKAAVDYPIVAAAFAKVLHLLAPPPTLMAPSLTWRVMLHRQRPAILWCRCRHCGTGLTCGSREGGGGRSLPRLGRKLVHDRLRHGRRRRRQQRLTAVILADGVGRPTPTPPRRSRRRSVPRWPQSRTELPATNDMEINMTYGHGYEVATRRLGTLAPDVIDVMVPAFEARTSPLSSIIIHHCHGVATEVAPDATAFGCANLNLTALIYAAWTPAVGDGEPHRRWACKLSADLAPAALPGGYANLLPDSAAGQIAYAFGRNASRLSSLKTQFDPAGTLRAIPLPPAAARASP